MTIKEISSSIVFRKTLFFLMTVGFALCFGSIATFIVMNFVLGSAPSLEAIYWQRMFVAKIMYYSTVPGMWILFLSGTIVTLNQYGVSKNLWFLLKVFILLAIVINGTFIIVPLADKVNELAIKQYQLNKENVEYLSTKTMEDIFGALNFIILILGLTLATYKEFCKGNEKNILP